MRRQLFFVKLSKTEKALKQQTSVSQVIFLHQHPHSLSQAEVCAASNFLRQAGVICSCLEDVHKGEHVLPAIMDLNWWEKDIKIQLAEKKKSQFQTLEQLCDFLPIYTHIFLSKFISPRDYWKNIYENEAFRGISQVSEETVKHNELSFKLTSCFCLWILGGQGF